MQEEIIALDEIIILKAIIRRFSDKFFDYTGLVTAYYLMQAGWKGAVFEKKLSMGGGMRIGSMILPGKNVAGLSTG